MVSMRKIYTLLIALIFGTNLQAQITTYTRTVLSGQTYTSISGGTVINSAGGLTTGGQDDGGVLVTLPFTFTYNGTGYSTVTFCTNGWIAFGNQTAITTIFDGRNPANMFATAGPQNMIAAWFGDGGANFGGVGIGSMVHGAAGTGIYAFEWKDACGSGFTLSASNTVNYMIKLYGPTSSNPGRIELLYGLANGTVSTGRSCGIRNATGGANNYINALDGSFTSTATTSGWFGNGNGYRFDVPVPCSGTPAPGNTVSNINPVCPGQTFTLSLQNTTPGTGVTYQWQSSPNGTTWTNISGATSSTLATSQTVATFYRCGVTCASNTGFSNALQLNMNTFLYCYCAANYTSGCGSSDVITNVTFGSLNNNSTCASLPATTDYGLTVAAPNISIASTVPFSATVGAGGGDHVAIWIDYNQNGTFETTEYTYIGKGNGSTVTSNITIPANATPGLTKMRVRVRYSTSNTPQIANTDPCTTFSFGETEDYNINLVCDAPAFTTQPVSTSLCTGNSATFTSAASGSGVSYQWQVNTGTGFTNVTNGGVYSGATTASLTVTLPTVGFNGYQYRCVASVLCTSTTATSSIATLSVSYTTAILADPINTTVCNGDPVTFTINALASNTTYQWQVHDGTGYYNLSNTGIYTGVNTDTLRISAATSGINSYAYRCVVGSTCPPNTIISAAAILTIGTAIPVITQPVNTTICSGGNANFSVATGGANVVYQWQVNAGSGFTNIANGTDYSGATTSSLSILNTPLSFNAYQYRCVLSNGCVSPFFTNTADLTVQPSPVISTQPLSVTSCDFQSVGFNVVATGSGLSYQWQVNTGLGFVNLTNTAPYSGVFSTGLGVANVTNAMNGYQYRCIIIGSCSPSVVSNTVTLNINTRPVLSTGPVNATICDGGNTSYSVTATGTALTYQWQVNIGSGFTNITNTGIYSGATTSTLNLTAVTNAAHSNQYRCVVGGTCSPSVTSGNALLFVNSAPFIANQPVDKQVCAGSNITFNVAAAASTSANPLSYQWQINTGTGFTNLSNTAPYSNVTTPTLVITGATTSMNGYRYRCLISNQTCTPTVLTNAVLLTVNTLPTVTTQPSAQTQCPGTTATFVIAATGTGITYQWQENNGTGFINLPGNSPYTGAGSPTLSIASVTPAMNNYQYRCVVKGECTPTVISNPVSLIVLTPITVNSNTISDTVCEGGTVKLGVRATGAGVLYQWQRMQSNGTYVNLTNNPPYSGVTTDSLRISGAPASLATSIYRCALTETQLCNLWYYTQDIPLTVNPAPVVNPSSLLTGPGKIATFSVAAAGTSYQWQENDNSGNGYRNLSEGGMYNGVYTNTLRVGPATLLQNGNMYRCIVDGVCTIAVASTSGQLIVDPALSVTNIRNADGVDVYPNPTSGNEVNVSFKKAISGQATLRITDKLGKVVFVETVNLNNNTNVKLSLPDMAAGVYMLQIVSEQNNVAATAQFVKQ